MDCTLKIINPATYSTEIYRSVYREQNVSTKQRRITDKSHQNYLLVESKSIFEISLFHESQIWLLIFLLEFWICIYCHAGMV